MSSSAPAAMTSLAERLREAGYVTGFLSNSPVIDLPGFTQGFEEIEHLGEESTTSGLAVPLTERAGLFLERHKDERFFLYVHYLDPHGPYRPPARLRGRIDVPQRDRPVDLYRRVRPKLEELVERGFGPGEPRFEDLVARYDAENMFVDESVGELHRRLEDLGLAGNSLLVLTSDHGEEFLEHGYVEHAWTLYRESVHVPLLFWAPEALAPSRISTVVSLIDVVPSLLDILELPPAEDLGGRSLFSEAIGQGRPLYGELLIDWRNRLRSVEHEGWKYVAVLHWLELAERQGALRRGAGAEHPDSDRWARAIREELYDLTQDPGELRSRTAEEPARLQAMRSLLQELRERCPGPREPEPAEIPLDSEERQRMRALGYVD